MADQHEHLVLIERTDVHRGVVVIVGYSALVCWWVGIASYMYVGGLASGGSGVVVFLTIPVLATVATIVVARRRRHTSTGKNLARHRFES